jgi:hypothetical protein
LLLLLLLLLLLWHLKKANSFSLMPLKYHLACNCPVISCSSCHLLLWMKGHLVPGAG